MSLNTRKKQVKPKVTIDQKEATISTGKKFKGAFSGIFFFFSLSFFRKAFLAFNPIIFK